MGLYLCGPTVGQLFAHEIGLYIRASCVTIELALLVMWPAPFEPEVFFCFFKHTPSNNIDISFKIRIQKSVKKTILVLFRLRSKEVQSILHDNPLTLQMLNF